MKATANATRQGGWWAIEVPEIPGLFTQARRLDQVAEMVIDAAATLGHEVEDVEVVSVLPAGQDAVDAAKRSRLLLQDAERAASAANREAVGALLAAGLTVRDAAVLMGVSPQRISAIGQAIVGADDPRIVAAKGSEALAALLPDSRKRIEAAIAARVAAGHKP